LKEIRKLQIGVS